MTNRLNQIASSDLSGVPRRDDVRVAHNAPLFEVVSLMAESKVSTVLVTRDGSLAGVFTERDLMLRVDASSKAWRSAAVVDYMTPAPTVVRAKQTIEEALNTMLVGEFRHLPLLDDDGQLLGIISIQDLLAHIAEFFPEDFINLPPDPTREARGPYGG